MDRVWHDGIGILLGLWMSIWLIEIFYLTLGSALHAWIDQDFFEHPWWRQLQCGLGFTTGLLLIGGIGWVGARFG